MARPSKITRQPGFTLVESLIASVVLALAVVGIAGTLAASHAQNSALETTSIAVSLARQLMEEIASKPLVSVDATPGWPSQTNRSNYDSINDYNGYHDTAPVAMLGGSSSGVQAGFTRTVALSYPTTLFGGNVTSGDWVLINITVRDRVSRAFTLSRLVARTTIQR